MFANLHLDDPDYFVKEQLRVPAYLRYVDDMVILNSGKAGLAELDEAVSEGLARNRMRLHPNKAHISRVDDGLYLFGYHLLTTWGFILQGHPQAVLNAAAYPEPPRARTQHT